MIGLMWVFFLTLNYFETIRHSWVNFFTLGSLFAVSMLYLINIFIKRIEYSSKQIKITPATPSTAEKPTAAAMPAPAPLVWLSHPAPLSSLPNSLFFNETLNKAINYAQRRNTLLAVLLVDISPVKLMTSPAGNSIAAPVIKEINDRLVNILRAEDILAKWESNEFIILLNDIGKAKFASSVANKILQACIQPLKTEIDELTLTANIGICIYPTEGNSLEDLLKNADIALSKAKNAGSGVYRFYSQTMDAEAAEYIHLEKSLRKAITNNEFTLYYQPKIHLKTGNINRLEALIRWVQPEIGIISPEKFLPVAEETGLINPLGEWALREACKMNKQWQNAGYEHMPIAVNLSPKQFYHPDIAQVIAAVLKNTELNPNYLELEITETAIMDNPTKAIDILADIKATGVQISIDHFGAGHFSISQLKQFPLTLLKIDQSFIKGVPNNPNDSAIITAIIALAHNLGLEVVAEGVETAEQVQYLSLQNCDMVQGYFLSQPLPAEQIALQFKKLMERVL
jgi:diguanylate cyclase (GGDEF)-like protein